MSLTLIGEVVGDNDGGINRGGVLIKVVNGGEVVVGAVAFDRSEGEEKGKDFATKIDEEVAKARKAIAVINDLATDPKKLK